MLWIGQLGDLILPIGLLLGDDDSNGFLDRAVKVAHHRRGPDVREHLSLPHQKVFARKLFGDGVAEGGEGGHSHGVGGRGGRHDLDVWKN